MIFTLDTNVLYYAIHDADPEKRKIASDILGRMLTQHCILTTQVLGEFLSAVRRKNRAAFSDARILAEDWCQLFAIASTSAGDVSAAAIIADRYKLQFWDSVIIAVASSAGAGTMFTEDMQDNATIAGITCSIRSTLPTARVSRPCSLRPRSGTARNLSPRHTRRHPRAA